MRLSYYALFPDQAESPIYHRLTLNKRNAYNLPEGEYFIYDHYPTQMREEPAVYLSVESASSRQHLATLQIQLPPVVSKADIRISSEYLQSPDAPKVLALLEKQIIKDRHHLETLSQRLLAVAESNLQLLLPQTLMARGVLSQLGDTIGQLLEEPSLAKRQTLLDDMLSEMGRGLLAGIEAASTPRSLPPTPSVAPAKAPRKNTSKTSSSTKAVKSKGQESSTSPTKTERKTTRAVTPEAPQDTAAVTPAKTKASATPVATKEKKTSTKKNSTGKEKTHAPSAKSPAAPRVNPPAAANKSKVSKPAAPKKSAKPVVVQPEPKPVAKPAARKKK